MPTHRSTLTVEIRRPGRQAEEEWQTIEPQIVLFWKTAAKLLSHRTYEHDGCQITIALNWASLGRRVDRDCQLLMPLRTGKAPEADWFSKIERRFRINARCDISGRNELSKHAWYATFFVEYLIYEVFTVANLACPGAAEFLNITVQGNRSDRTEPLRLSAWYFDEWKIESLRGAGPAAKVLLPQEVIAWFRAVNPRVTQKAENSTQRALFALYELCRSDGRVEFVLWLFNALESLLATRVGENFSGLVRRASLLLNLEAKASAELGKRLRKLYDLRSAFIHGGYEIAHPLHREPIDDRLNDDYDNLLQLGKYGFSVLAAILQAMIEQNLVELKFEERLAVSKNAP